MAENTDWQTRFVEYPNSSYSRYETSIKLSDGAGCTYCHVDGGFKIEMHRKNAKIYTSEIEIRDKLLRQLLAKARKDARLIKATIDKNMLSAINGNEEK